MLKVEGGEVVDAKMETLPYTWLVEPFGKINYWCQPDGSKRVRVYILRENIKEGAQTGVAIDGSTSMRSAFGYGGTLDFLLKRQPGVNMVSLTARRMCSYLARKVDADTKTTVIYWGTGADGSGIEEVGDLTAYQSEQYDFAGPKKFGSRARLLPAVRYFVDRFADAPWGMYIFITNGRFQDLDAVKQYTGQLAHDIAAGRRNDLKLVMIGVGQQIDQSRMQRQWSSIFTICGRSVGQQIDQSQMQQLDDLDTGTAVDLWDYKVAEEMRSVVEIFAEVVDENTIVADRGLIRDSSGMILRDYRDRGVPALLRFTLPPGSKSFTLEIRGQSFTQPIL